MSQTINLTGGAVEYTFPLTITEVTGKDISANVIQLSLGTDTAVGVWYAPDTDVTQAVTYQRVVQLLVGMTLAPAVGVYWLWSKVTDAPETVPRRHGKVTIL